MTVNDLNLHRKGHRQECTPKYPNNQLCCWTFAGSRDVKWNHFERYIEILENVLSLLRPHKLLDIVKYITMNIFCRHQTRIAAFDMRNAHNSDANPPQYVPLEWPVVKLLPSFIFLGTPKENSRFLNQFFHAIFVRWIKHEYSYKIYPHINSHFV